MAESKNTIAQESEQEVWKPIPDFPGYEASNLGNIRSWRNVIYRNRSNPHILSQFETNELGYMSVSLQQHGKAMRKYVHGLVLLSFVGPRPSNMVCCHLDDNPKNNRLDNIKWDTQRNNLKQAIDNGNIAHGERNANTFLSEEEIITIRNMISSGKKASIVARMFNVDRSLVNRVSSGRSWKYTNGPILKRDSTVGSNNGLAKLNEAQVEEIRTRFSNGESSYKLASDFCVSRVVISKICRGESWKHANGPITKCDRYAGEHNRSAKLTDREVAELRVRYAKNESTKLLAKEFSISTTTVKRICNGSTRKSAAGPITIDRKSLISHKPRASYIHR